MQTTTVLDFSLTATEASEDDPNLNEVLGRMPELPSLGQRWTVRRKAAVIEAVRGDWVPIEENMSALHAFGR
jgi:hypothetical protein